MISHCNEERAALDVLPRKRVEAFALRRLRRRVRAKEPGLDRFGIRVVFLVVRVGAAAAAAAAAVCVTREEQRNTVRLVVA